MSFALDIPYPAGTSGVSTALSKVAEGILNRLSRLGGVAVRRAGVVVGVLWPETMGDGTLFGAIANLLAEDQVRWVNDVAGATGVSTLVIGQELVDQLAVWEYANPGVAPPTYLYDDVVVQAQAAAAPQSGPTPNNVRISRILATTLGACAVLACAPPFLGGAHACMQQPPGDGYDSHHMPAKSTSPLDDPMGPAIKIDPLDHKATNSYGAGVNGPMYADRRALISAGRVYAAFRLDVAEIRRKFPGKYDAGLAQAEAYAACLKAHGFIR